MTERVPGLEFDMNKLILPVLFVLSVCLQLHAQTDLVGSGRAIQFDGVDDYVDLGNIYDDINFPLTISAWIYKDASNQYISPIFVSQDNVSIYNGFWFCLSATNLFFEYGDGRGDQNPAYRKGKSAALPNINNRWIYVTAVAQSASNIQLFANGYNIGGSIQGSSSQPMSSDFPGDVAKIGYMYTNSVTHRFDGMIDELRIWNRALSETEIRQTMCKRLKGNEANLIGYWNFDETEGDQLIDSSPNRFNGTLKGSPTRVFSGAPVGDESAFLYSSTWTGKSLLAGDLSVGAVSGNPYGVHIYTVNSLPSQTGGLNVPDVELPYYGVFLADDGRTNTFDLTFTGNNVCKSFQREDNSEPDWIQTHALTGIPGRVEIIPVFEPGGVYVDLGADMSLCDQNSFVLEAAADPTGKTFLWSNGETTHNITITTSGQYAVEVREGCFSDKDTVEVSFITTPAPFSLGPDESLCTMEPRTLTLGFEADGYDLAWHNGSDDDSLLATHFGTYWLKIQNACGSSADSVTFIQKFEPDLQVNLGPDVTFCQKLPFFLLAHAQAEGKTFQWNTGENTPVITVNSSGIYAVEVRSECQIDRDTISISYLTAPPVFSLGEDQILCSLEPRTLNPSVETNDVDFTWHNGSKEKSFLADDFGTYWVKAENACGVSLDSITFTRQIYSDIEQYNFISPDNTDDHNQFFMLDAKLLGSQLAVFNRWGKQVYQSRSYHNNWDGGGLPSGVYFYTVNGECIEPLKGTLTIMR